MFLYNCVVNSMVRAIYPGSFDPVTYGHLDVIKRASKIVDELIVGVLNNKSKTPLFSVENRVKMLNDAVSDLPNVKVMSFEVCWLTSQKVDAQLIVRYYVRLQILNMNFRCRRRTVF